MATRLLNDDPTGQLRPQGVAAPLARMIGWIAVLLGALAMFGMAHAAASGGPHLYRFTNAQGRIEIAYAVPPDRAAGGYEIIDAKTGAVVERVAAELTPAQIAEKEAHARCAEQLERVMSRYGSISDIDVAAGDADRSSASRLESIEASLSIERRRLDQLVRSAAEQERAGRVVTDELKAQIAESGEQIETLKAELAQRRSERQSIADSFAIERRIYLSGKCEL